MPHEVKAVVVAKDGVAKIGNDILTLRDESTITFKTTSMDAFLQYLGKMNSITHATDAIGKVVKTEDKMRAVFYDNTRVSVCSTTPSYRNCSDAVCTMEMHPLLKRIMNIVNKEISITVLDEFLYEMRADGDLAANEVYDRLQKFQVKKAISVTREKDRAGNYICSVECQDKEGTREFPPKIGFTVPVFQHSQESIIVNVDFYIMPIEVKDGIEIRFCLKDPLISEIVEARGKEIIETILEGVPLPRYFGNLETFAQTDIWRYKENKLG
jgi:hypothetical protein